MRRGRRRFRLLSDLSREQLAEATERSELKRADRTFIFPEHLRDLAGGHVLDETKYENFLLLGREVLHRAAKRVDLLATHRAIMSGRAILGDAIRVIEVDRGTLAAATIGHRVARDRVEPGEEGLALPPVAMDVRERPREYLGRQVLGVAGLADAVQHVAVDRVAVGVVQLGERRTVATPGPVDDVRDRRERVEWKR